MTTTFFSRLTKCESIENASQKMPYLKKVCGLPVTFFPLGQNITAISQTPRAFFALFEKLKCKSFTLQILFQKSHFFHLKN